MHPNAVKPRVATIVLATLVCASLVSLARPAAAELLPLRTEDVRAALAGQRESSDPVQIRAFGSLPAGHPAVPNDEAASALIAYAGEIAPAGAGPVRTEDDAISALRRYAEEVAAGQQPIRLAAVVKAPPDAAEAAFVGQQVCLGCHAVQAASFGVTLMGKVFRNPREARERGGCETCHGPGSLHVKAGGGRSVGGLISFRQDDPRYTAEDYNTVCLGCHQKGNRILWRGSTHELRGIACTNCHTVMTNVTPKHQLAKLTEMDTCFQCHKNKRAEMWRSSHMPVREGKLTCSSCHNPHGSYGESLLREATVNDNCYKCHAEKRGPFLWEHPPVRENCLNCHDPHGSINDFLLKMARPRVCQQCHANLTGHPGNPRNPLSVYAISRGCQNCHTQHHGSNSPAGVRFQR